MAQKQGLYHPSFEHDSCGIGFVANLNNQKSFTYIQNALDMLVNMEHRGGCGCEPETGDGAGILLQIPHEFYAKECDKLGFNLPGFREYGVAMTFFPERRKIKINNKVKT
jgi:glutamate synthase (NADPH/NADH) large chain